jgi:hypothetical protein
MNSPRTRSRAAREAAAELPAETCENAPDVAAPRRASQPGPAGKTVFAFGSSGWLVRLVFRNGPPSSCWKPSLAPRCSRRAAPVALLHLCRSGASQKALEDRARVVVGNAPDTKVPRSDSTRPAASLQFAYYLVCRSAAARGSAPRKSSSVVQGTLMCPRPTHQGVVKALKEAGLHENAYLIATSGGASACPFRAVSSPAHAPPVAGCTLFFDVDLDAMVEYVCECAAEARGSLAGAFRLRKYVGGAIQRLSLIHISEPTRLM